MYQTRAKLTKKLPLHRKGTKYVARARSHVNDSVPVVIAIRDMLHLARNSKEVKFMINQKALKINDKDVKNHRESIRLFNILSADKQYMLTLTPTGKYTFEETKAKEVIHKVTNKKLIKGKKIQLNLHDGTNVISQDGINVHDTIYLDFSGKIKKHVKFESGKECIVISGKYIGLKGKIENLEAGKVKIKFKEKDSEPILDIRSIVVL